MSLFTLNWRTQITNLLPSFLRFENVIDFITALTEPLTTKASEWATYDTLVRRESLYNGQVIVLTAALNKIMGITVAPFIQVAPSVTITSANVYIYNDSEASDLYIYNSVESNDVYFYNETETAESGSFTVRIPAAIFTDEADRQITKAVNLYKIAGKVFITQSYT